VTPTVSELFRYVLVVFTVALCADCGDYRVRWGELNIRQAVRSASMYRRELSGRRFSI
jgi:hypothetical protein